MFTKLLKHEMKAQRGLFTILSLFALGAGLVGGLTLLLLESLSRSSTNSMQVALLSEMFASSLLVFSFMAVIIYAAGIFFVLLYRFYKYHFSDEGYLTFTLPATTHQHLLSSILSIAIYSILSIVISIVSFGLILSPIFYFAYRDYGDISDFVYIFTIWGEIFGEGEILVQCLSYVASSIYSLVLPLVAITIGSLVAKKHKILASFGIYYGLNMVISIITGVINMFTLISDAVFVEANGNLSFMFTSIFSTVLYLGLAVGGYFLMHHLVDKKLNLP